MRLNERIPVLDVQLLSKSFGGVQAVDSFSMKVHKGDIIGIIGPNGAGKTTIFNLISGIYRSDNGTVQLTDLDITNREQHYIAINGIGRTFQNIRLFKALTVLENTVVANDSFSKYGILGGLLFSSQRRREEKRVKKEGEYWLEMVGLHNVAEEKPDNLSYGYQRKLEIARALALKPKLLLLDEPAAGLTGREVQELMMLIRRLKEELEISILIIEHRMEVIMGLCHFIYVQNFGKTLAKGTPVEIQKNELVIHAYLGEDT